MIVKMFSLFDSKAQMFTPPAFMQATGAGIRWFSDMVNRRNGEESMISRHPGDFVLYEIGEFDDSTGQCVNYAQHKHLGVGSQYKEEQVAFVQNGKDVTRSVVSKADRLREELEAAVNGPEVH